MPSLTKFTFGVIASLAVIASAHPGHDIAAEAAERAEFIKRSAGSVTKKYATIRHEHNGVNLETTDVAPSLQPVVLSRRLGQDAKLLQKS